MDHIGKYEILEKIGQGAMGAVYRARDSVIGRDVAIKVISDNALNTSDIKERFYREARSAGRLSHENITTIYDVGEDNGHPYIVMEYLEGDDLRSMINPDASHTPEEKLDVAIQICQGLHFAHRHNVIHRDIKPDNVRVLPNGRVKILDFGIARIQDDTEFQTLTLTGTSIGTPRYMSPEQIRGETLDARSDIFSFGVLFYELLSGTAPFFGDRVATIIYMILNVDPEPFEFDPKVVSKELQPILFKCLAKEKEDRYNDFTEILRDLQSVLRLTTEVGDSLKSQILDSTISDFLAKDAVAVSSEPTPELLEKNSVPSSKKRTWVYAGVVALAVVLVTIGVLVLGSESTTPGSTDRVESDGLSSSVSAGATSTGENQQNDTGEGVGNVNRDEISDTDNSTQTPPPSGGNIARSAADQNRADQQSAEQAAPIKDGEQSAEIVEEDPGQDLEEGAILQDGAAELNQAQSPTDPSEADAERSAMLDAKGRVMADMQRHPVFLAALIQESDGSDAYDSSDYDRASELFRSSTIGFVEAGSIRSNLDSVIARLVRRLDSGYGGMNLIDLRDVHDFYASDYYATLFGIAVELSTSTSASSIGVTTQGASAIVSSKFVYKNNKNEEIGFERREQWTFQEVNGSWNLVDVQSL